MRNCPSEVRMRFEWAYNQVGQRPDGKERNVDKRTPLAWDSSGAEVA